MAQNILTSPLSAWRAGRYAQNPGTVANTTVDGVTLRADLAVIADLIAPGSRVFDVGCGSGDLLAYLKTQRQVIGRGLELSEAGVLACVRRGLSVRQGNLETSLLDYPDQAFDYVVLSETLPYLDDPVRTLHEMVRVGRRAIVSFANWGNWRCRTGLLVNGCLSADPARAQPWYASARSRAVSVRDFVTFCQAQNLAIVGRHHLAGTRRLRSPWADNLRTTIAVFELEARDGTPVIERDNQPCWF